MLRAEGHRDHDLPISTDECGDLLVVAELRKFDGVCGDECSNGRTSVIVCEPATGEAVAYILQHGGGLRFGDTA